MLKRGKHRALLWPGREADGSADSSTPSKTRTRDEMGRLEKVVESYHLFDRDIDRFDCTASEKARERRFAKVGLAGQDGVQKDDRDPCCKLY